MQEQQRKVMVSGGVPFDPRELAASVPFVELHYLPSVNSTNDWAISHTSCRELDAPPALFVTDEQSHGRGRGDHRWHSGPGALTFSIMVRRPMALDSPWQGLIALAMADAVCEAIRKCQAIETSIKWPNDIILNDRKLGGILIESPDRRWLVAGIGVNANNSSREIDRAISLIDRTGNPVDRVRLLSEIVARSIDHFQEMAGNNESGCSLWRDRLLARCIERDWLKGKSISCKSGTETWSGTGDGLAPDGSLIMKLADQGTKQISAGQITVSDG